MNTDTTVKFLSAITCGKWVSGVNDPISQQNNLDQLKHYLGDIIRTEHVNVLAAAGASYGTWLAHDHDENKPRAEPTRKGLWAKAREIWINDIEDLLELVKYNRDELGEDIEALLSQCHLAQSFAPKEEVKSFVESMETAIVEACRFVDANTDLTTHELFLRKAGRRSRRLPRLKVFTTNYDLCFERAARNANFIVVDGFSHTLPQEFSSTYFSYDFVRRGEHDESPDYIPNVFHLYKLHGSVDWGSLNGNVYRKAAPKSPLLIYPRRTKFESSYEPPFIDMMGRFQASLREPNTAIIVVGYGFADNHLTQPILSAVRSNVSLRLVVVDPILDGEDRSSAVGWLEELIKAGDTRICLIAGTFDNFVRLLPDPDVRTQEEMHVDRLKRLQA